MSNQPTWMTMAEIEAELRFKDSAELSAAFQRVRQSMAERADSEEANRERLRDAQAAADCMLQPVIYSRDRS